MLDPVLRDVHLVVGAQVQRRAARLQAPEAALGLRLPQQLPQPAPLQDGGQIQVADSTWIIPWMAANEM